MPSGVDASTGQILGIAFCAGFDGYVWTTKSWAAPGIRERISVEKLL